MKKISVLIYLILPILIFSQSYNPKREFRGAWIATVVNLDWPSSRRLSSYQQKAELISLFDYLESLNLNAVVFQVRTESDAFYNSSYDPWSYWLTGSQGTPPSPYYDPLEFAVEEAHKRGMELHAWFNPYRVERDIDSYPNATNHVSVEHPEWTLSIGDTKILNPGIREARKYVTNVIMDVVERYDVDGVHFDDYFYTYEPIQSQDYQTFNDDPRGFLNINDWRRDNINELLRMINDSIQVVRPEVKFGISPFGIYKPGVPSGIKGFDAYNVLYCDPIKWLNEKIIDYINPQLYWAFGGGQDYGKLLPWWATQTNGRHLYSGQALYRANEFSSGEIPNQIKLNRNTENCQGSVFFRAKNFYNNSNGVTDSITQNYYKYKALIPQMSWKDSINPNPPLNLRYEQLANIRGQGLVWETPNNASDGDTASMYAIYQVDSNNPAQTDFDNHENIVKITNQNSAKVLLSNPNNSGFFAITSLDKNYNESTSSNILEINITKPGIPDLISPLADSDKQRDTTKLVWSDSDGAEANHLQIAADSLFNHVVFDKTNIVDTSYNLTFLEGLEEYYWRVSASNIVGESDFSITRNFSTGFPVVPELVSPSNLSLDIAYDTLFTWNKSDSSKQYQFQLAEGLSIGATNIVVDTILSDTSLYLRNLTEKQLYIWHVRGINQFGNSKWSVPFQFKTKVPTDIDAIDEIPIDFALSQNYPNPFNPVTTIEFTIPKSEITSVKIYDILGKEVALLKNEYMERGKHSVKFDGSKFSSGIYIYVLKSGKNLARKKMLLLK